MVRIAPEDEESVVRKEAPDASCGASGGGETCIKVYGSIPRSVPPLSLQTVFRQVLYILLPCPCLGCRRPVPGPDRTADRRAGPNLRCLCPDCETRLVGSQRSDSGEPASWAFEYRPPLDEVIQALKFRRLDYLADSLAELALPAARRVAQQAGGLDAVVPVPLHWRRRWRRGYDQAALLAAALARGLDLPMSKVLRRTRATPAQSLPGRDVRRGNLAGAFALRRSWQRRGLETTGRLRDLRVLLVDDVVTTGSTLREAAATLRTGGALAVHPFAVAWTPEDADLGRDSKARETARRDRTLDTSHKRHSNRKKETHDRTAFGDAAFDRSGGCS